MKKYKKTINKSVNISDDEDLFIEEEFCEGE